MSLSSLICDPPIRPQRLLLWNGKPALTKVSFSVLDIYTEVECCRFRPPASVVVLEHDEQVELAVIVEVAGDDVVHLGREV